MLHRVTYRQRPDGHRRPGRRVGLRDREEREPDQSDGCGSNSRREHHRAQASRALRRHRDRRHRSAGRPAHRKRGHLRPDDPSGCSSTSRPTRISNRSCIRPIAFSLGSNGRTVYKVPAPLAAGFTYFWRVRALDGANVGPYSPVASFKMVAPVIIEAPVAVEPAGNLSTNRPQLQGEQSEVLWHQLGRSSASRCMPRRT